MIELELRSLHSPDVEVDVWEPEGQSVWFLLQLQIGTRGDVATDTFDVMIATPSGLLERASVDEYCAVARRGTIVFREFTWPNLHKTIQKVLRECEAENWAQSVLRLQRFFFWEYEDYLLEPPDASN
jgi:hypothetical protein